MALEREGQGSGFLTTTQPGLGLTAKPAARGPKLAIAPKVSDNAHLPLTSPGGIVMKGGYLGRQTRTNE